MKIDSVLFTRKAQAVIIVAQDWYIMDFVLWNLNSLRRKSDGFI